MPFVDPDFNDPDEGEKPKREVSPLLAAKVGLKLGKAALNLTPLGPALNIPEKLGEFAQEAGGRTTDVTGSPAAGAAVNTALSAIPMMFGGAPSKGGSMALSELARTNPVRAATLKAAQAEGYVVPPSEMGSGQVERLVESIGGRADIARQASMKNQQVTNMIARREAGLAENEPLTEATLKEARNRIAEPYRQIADISPKASAALEALKQARAEAKIYWQHYGRSAEPASLKKAEAMDLKAEALETKISKLAGELAPDLMPALKEARVQLAKNYDVEKALNLGSGDVDARVIGRILDKKGTDAVTGGLQTIGKFAKAYEPYAKPNAGPTDVNKLTPYAAMLLGGAGAQGSEYFTGHPYGAALGLLPLLAPGARGFALSKAMQEGIPLSGILRKPIQAGMVPLSRVGEAEPGRQ